MTRCKTEMVPKTNYLTNHKNYLDLILNNINNLVIELDENFRVIEFNKAAEQYYRKIKKEIFGKKFSSSLYHDDFKSEIKFIQAKLKAVKHTDSVEFKIPWKAVGNEEFFAEWKIFNLRLIMDCNAYVLIAKLLTPEEFVKVQQEKIDNYLQNFASCMPGIFYWKSKEGVYLNVNDGVLSILKMHDKREIVGKTDEDLWPSEAEELRANDRKVMESGKPVYLEETVTRKNGENIYFTVIKVPLRDAYGNIVGIIGNSLDITELKNTQKALAEAKEKAELVSEMKTQFIQNMQHDLRTPAAGVAQLTEILCEDEKNPEQKDRLRKVANASKRLLDLLNDILEFDKISSGKLPVLLQKVDIRDLANAIIEIETPTTQLKNLDLQLSIADAVPHLVITDKTRIFRIMLNLVSNAIKFTNKGFVKVAVAVAKQIDPKKILLKITVADSGIGIPKDKQRSIYERFVRCIPSNTGLYTGSGLGLSISKQFVDELYGEIDVESSEGNGTTFTCLIPVALSLIDMEDYQNIFANPQYSQFDVAPTSTLPEVSYVNQKNGDFTKLNILVIEDDEIAQYSAEQIFADSLGVNFTLAKTGIEALQLIQKNKYDVIFSDMGLPDISGCAVASEIRKTDKITPIISLTANDSVEFEQRCTKAGINDFIIKPLSVAKAKCRLEKWLFNSTQLKAPKVVDDITRSNEVIDFSLTKMGAGNDENCTKFILKKFTDSLPQYRLEIEKLLKEQDFTKLAGLMHKLKGACIYAGAARLYAVVAKLENIVKTKKVKLDIVESTCGKIFAEIEHILQVYSTCPYRD